MRERRVAVRMARGMSRGRAASRSRARGAGRTKTRRHDVPVRSPPRTRPKEKPAAPVAPYLAIARLRCAPSGQLVVMIDNAAGTVKPADMPLMRRAEVQGRECGAP